jgi:hypothetical protein
VPGKKKGEIGVKNPKMFVLAVIVLTVALLACSIGGGDSESSQESTAAPTAGDEQAGAEVEAGSAEEAATEPPESVEQDLTLSSVTEGLAVLQSYKSATHLTFVGTDAEGQPVNGSLETREDFTQEPKAQRVQITSTGFEGESTPQGGTLEMITIGDTSYMVTQESDGTTSCISMSSSEDTQMEQGLFSPNVLGDISGAKYIKTETVNDIKAKHYTWEEGSLAGLGFTSAKGDVWVAVDGNYVVKYTAKATGKGTLFGSTEEEGTITVEYTLIEVNGSFTIEAPADCAAPATDIPVMADAQEKAVFGEMISYSSPSAFADVVAFYEVEMPNSGWQPSGEPTKMDELASLEFTKDNRTASVMLTYDTETQLTSVLITTSTE